MAYAQNMTQKLDCVLCFLIHFIEFISCSFALGLVPLLVWIGIYMLCVKYTVYISLSLRYVYVCTIRIINSKQFIQYKMELPKILQGIKFMDRENCGKLWLGHRKTIANKFQNIKTFLINCEVYLNQCSCILKSYTVHSHIQRK